ncbi:amino acid adenylation domain-containing protein [Paenibacillus alvei]|uniref:amino acid adenylation domain-containing protein n=1 Tax=Paenibacillus alvei TaxID=44250 RepID=UPI00228071B5|nr:non-ribosomal peptide synthetase [Paenibacillus alvei]MCY7483275.1 amino acid adenylation domain-containing protein [Paenibacillus alvei]
MHDQEKERWPLSGAQAGIWFAQQLDPDNPIFNTAECVDIRGPIDPARFEAALRQAVTEADALHIRFGEDADGPWQKIVPTDDWMLHMIDLSREADPEGAARAWMNRDMEKPVDLHTGPLFTEALFKIESERYLWYQRIHHIVIDGFGAALLMQRVAQNYTALTYALPNGAGTFGSLQSILEEDEAYRSSEQMNRDREFWLERFSDRPEAVSLGGHAQRTARRFVRRTAHIPAATVSGWQSIAAESGTSWPDVLAAATAIYVHRMTQEEEVILGLPVMCRLGSAALRVPGMVMNLLPLRVEVSSEKSLGDLLREVSREIRMIRRHQGYRHQDLRRDLKLLGDNRRLFGPLINVMPFVEDVSFAGYRGKVSNLSAGPVDDLTINVYSHADGSGLRLDFDANPEIYSLDELYAHQKRFLHLLDGIAHAESNRPLGQLPVITPEERRQVLEEWNDTAYDVPSISVPELFEEQVERAPEAVAVVCEDDLLRYGELNAKANRLAHYLISYGVGPDRIVALSLPRSLDAVIAILAIHKTGAAYLPLDPDYPFERLAYMLEDADPICLIATKETSASLPPCNRKTIVLDESATVDALVQSPAHNPTDEDRIRAISASHISYVIYTSGSTGKPKGVMLTFGGLANLLHDMKVRLALSEQDRMLSVTTISFDISVMELLLPLISGSALDIARKETILDPSALASRIAATGATIMQATPTLWQALADSKPERFAGLKMISGGEAIPLALKLALQELNGEVNNQYGPTETTIYSTAGLLDHSPTNKPSIGRPIRNTRLYVLDSSLEPVPPGVAGELYIAGAGLARGYLGRADLTAERFIADPFGPPGTRMYRTGDMVRWLADGTIDYLGRTDQQVKLRGFRIETGEIEALLDAHPDISQAAVTLYEDYAGERRLAAYVVPSSSSGLEPEELRQYAARKLPDYMVPFAFVVLDAMPLTPNRKIDRKALPAPERAAAAAGREPRTPQEEIICALFAEVLGLARVSIDDDFFALGGHSLLAGRVMVRVREAFGVEMNIGSLFEAPTAASLVRRLEPAQEQRPAIRASLGKRPERLPLSFAQQRLWFLYRLEGATPTYNIPLVARMSGELNVEALQAAVFDVVDRHETLRTIFPDENGTSSQVIQHSKDVQIPFHVLDVSEQDLHDKLEEAARYSFRLSEEPSLRVHLFRTGAKEQVLLLLLHHIAGDGWSLTPLTRDLSIAYEARCRGEAPAWTRLPVQYADYALWQERLLGSADQADSLIARQLDYWTEALKGLPEELELPTDYPRPPAASHKGGTVGLQIDSVLHGRLTELARGNRASLFMVLQAALAVLFTRLGAGNDIPLGSPISGRNDDALDGLIGLFINTLVIRTDTSGNPGFEELLSRVRKVSLEAYEHQDVPFERLVEILNPIRSRARHPLFQIMLVLQNTPEASLQFPGLSSSLQIKSVDTAKFDLTWELNERRNADGAPDGLDGIVEFSADLFKRDTVEMLAARYVRILESIALEPSKPIGEIDILLPEERNDLAKDWLAWSSTVPHAEQATIPQLFEAQAVRSPQAIAVVHEGAAITYEQLNKRANRLAHLLMEHRVGPEHIVALGLPRSMEMIVGVLAVLKAGAAYLPLDPDYPAERLAYMLEDAGPVCIVTDRRTIEKLPDGGMGAVPRILLDDPEVMRQLASCSESDPIEQMCRRKLSPYSPAYIIYTSGSTGKPKGVLIPHQNVVRLFSATEHWFHFGADDVWTLFHSYAFDFSVWEIWGALLHGGRLVIVPHAVSRSPEEFLGLLVQEGVTVLNQTPSAFYQLMQADREHPNLGQALSLRYIVFGGEALELGRLRDWYERHADDAPRLINMYGITETTVHVSFNELNRNSDVPGASSLIGGSIPDLRVYVLDDALQPVPYGVTGEMYVSGAGLARGYWGRPGLTAERFVADPFGPPGSRMYRTGDLAKRVIGGGLDYLGRADHQVKIRGFRIELGEIQAVLAKHPSVAQAAVIVREDNPGDKRLAAYVVPAANAPWDAVELRRHAASMLPDYMVPSAIIGLDALPLTPNGKLDRKALPAPDIVLDADGRNPRTPHEEVLCDLFAEVLGLRRVGIDDSFFELGGHSLLAVRLISRIREALGRELSIAVLFEAPTVSGLAERMELDRDSGNSALQVLLPLRTHGEEIPLFCVHPAGGLSWCYAGLMKHLGVNYPIYGLQARGIAQAEKLPQTLDEMTADYIRHIRLIQPQGPYRLLGWSLGGNVAHAMAVQLQEEGEEIAFLAMLDAYPSHYLPIRGEPDEEEALTALLALGGYDRDSIGDEPLTIASAIRILRSDSSALATLDEATIMNLKVTYENSVRLLGAYVPRRYEGDLLFFRSTIIPDWFDPIEPEMWIPYVGGRIERHDIACRHKDLCQPGPLAEIGASILEKLRNASSRKDVSEMHV